MTTNFQNMNGMEHLFENLPNLKVIKWESIAPQHFSILKRFPELQELVYLSFGMQYNNILWN